MPDAPLIAVILDAARPYDRRIIGGVARYAREQTPIWSLYVEEDPLQKLPDLKRWNGQGIIANFDDRRVAAVISGLSIPIVGVGGGYGWFDRDSSMPYVFTDNVAIGRSPKDDDDDDNDDEEIVLRPGPVSSKKHRKRGTDALKTGESVLKSSRKK